LLGRDAEAAKARLEADERGPRCREIAEALWHRADGITLNAQPRYEEGIPAYRRAIDLDRTLGVACAHLGTHLLGGYAEYPDEPIYLLSQGAFWEPAAAMPYG